MANRVRERRVCHLSSLIYHSSEVWCPKRGSRPRSLYPRWNRWGYCDREYEPQFGHHLLANKPSDEGSAFDELRDRRASRSGSSACTAVAGCRRGALECRDCLSIAASRGDLVSG